jgi:hypothetical protein
MEGLAEVMEFWLSEPMPVDLVDLLRMHAPSGLEIVRVKAVETPSKSLEALATGADYSAEVGFIADTMPSTPDPQLLELPGVESLELRSGDLLFSLRSAVSAAAKPRAVVARVTGINEEESVLIPIVRRGLWAEQAGARVPLFDAS